VVLEVLRLAHRVILFLEGEVQAGAEEEEEDTIPLMKLSHRVFRESAVKVDLDLGESLEGVGVPMATEIALMVPEAKLEF
jgi:ABC-type molybdate transport system ATPase subunit